MCVRPMFLQVAEARTGALAPAELIERNVMVRPLRRFFSQMHYSSLEALHSRVAHAPSIAGRPTPLGLERTHNCCRNKSCSPAPIAARDGKQPMFANYTK